MSVKARILKGGVQIALGQVLQQALLLGRNVFVARLLPPEQFGIALTLVTVISALDAVSELGIELFLIRSPDIEDESLQRTLHLSMIARGLVAAALIFLLAPLFAMLFGTPEATWAYRCLALVPLIRSCQHLDVRRFERGLRYWQGASNNLAAALVGAIVAVALALNLHHYSAMLWALLAQTTAMVIGTHLFSERRYRLGFNPAHARRLAAFGMPLMANGILLFMSMQADRLLVGAMAGVRELANYGTAVIVVGGVTQLTLKLSGSLYLPVLSGHSPGDPSYDRRFELCGAISSSIAIGVLALFGTIGQRLVQLAFGAAYDIPHLLVALLGIQSAFKIQRSWLQIGFLATANTKALLIANAVAGSGLAAGGLALWQGFGVIGMAACLVAGEFAATGVTILRQRRAGPAVFRTAVLFFFTLSSLILLVMTLSKYSGPKSEFVLQSLLAFLVLVLGGGAVLLSSPQSQRIAYRFLQATGIRWN